MYICYCNVKAESYCRLTSVPSLHQNKHKQDSSVKLFQEKQRHQAQDGGDNNHYTSLNTHTRTHTDPTAVHNSPRTPSKAH